jgi:serine O-acetyltransferase
MKYFIYNFRIQISAISEDARVYWNKRGVSSAFQSLLYVLTCHGWHIMFLFRISKIIYEIKIPIVSHILKIVFQIIWFLITTFYGIWLDLSNEIGKGFYIGHFSGIIIRGDFGDFCSVGQCVTVGTKGAGKSNGHPCFGNNVYIGAGAKVIGNIKIGNDVVIGANSVVTKSIPSNSLAVGIPAVLRRNIQ